MRRLLLAALGLALLPLGLAQAPAALSLDEVLELSLASPQVRLTEAGVAQAQAQLAVAGSLVSATLAAGYTQTIDFEGDGDSGSFDPITLNATFNVIPFGPSNDAVVRAGWDLERAQLTLEEARRGAVIEGVQGYLGALRAAQGLTLAEAEVAFAERSLEATVLRVQAGTVNQNQQRSAEVALEQARLDRSDARRSELDALASLANLLGVAVPGVAGEPGPARTVPPYQMDAQLAARGDVIRVQLMVAQAQQSLDSGVRDVLPSGSFDLSYSLANDAHRASLGASFDTRSFQPSVALSYDPDSGGTAPGQQQNGLALEIRVQVPLNSAVTAALDAARLNRDTAVQQLERTLALAGLDIENRDRSHQAASASAALNASLRGQRRQDLAIARERLELGLIGPLEVDRAELDLLDAELREARARDNALLALLRLLDSLALNPLEVL